MWYVKNISNDKKFTNHNHVNAYDLFICFIVMYYWGYRSYIKNISTKKSEMIKTYEKWWTREPLVFQYDDQLMFWWCSQLQILEQIIHWIQLLQLNQKLILWQVWGFIQSRILKIINQSPPSSWWFKTNLFPRNVGLGLVLKPKSYLKVMVIAEWSMALFLRILE